MIGSEYVGPRKFFQSFKYALEGISYCINTQKNMKIHFAIAIVTLMAGLALKISRLEFIMIIMSISTVFVCEIINTAVEKAIDATTQEYNPIAKIAKDVAAGAVLVAAINSVLVGLMIFGRFFLISP